jgi:NADH-quinone oxidoreductase subunit N
MLTFINNNIALYNQLPEIYLTVVILVQLILNLNLKNLDVSKHYFLGITAFIQSFFILFFAFLLISNCNYYATYNNFLIVNTIGTSSLKVLITFFSILALVPVAQGFNLQKLNLFEYYTIYLLAVLASLLLVSAGDFLSVYLLVEMQSLCFYILATFRKNSVFSVEAGVKYFIFGSIISCILLFALSLLYGSVGTLNFHDLNLLFFSFPFSNEYFGVNVSVVFSLILISIVFLFKLGVVPFHFWVPDVYEGAPISSTVIFSFLPKLVLFDLFIKISQIFGKAFQELEFFFIFVGLLSVSIGAFFAVTQSRIKRFFIYSSISQMGFPIFLLTINTVEARSTIYFFLIVYTVSSILTWISYLFLYQFSDKGLSVDSEKSLTAPLYLTDLSGLFFLDKTWAFFFSILFFSLAGIPPLAGFLAKFFTVFELIINKFYVSTIILIFFSALSTFYYVKIIKIMFFEPENKVKNRFNYFFEGFDIFIKLGLFISFFSLFLLVHAFFFMDAWLLFCKYVYFNNFF